MIQVKICGITNKDDALNAVELGANALGLIFAPRSPRAISVETACEITSALPVFTKIVGVFVDHSFNDIVDIAGKVRLDVVQLHGYYNPTECYALTRYHRVIKVLHLTDNDMLDGIERYPADAFLVDSCVDGVVGGTGVTCDWNLARKMACRVPVILAGGLTPENVCQGIKKVRPVGIDVCSGVEAYPGKKDYSKVREFLKKVRNSNDST